MGDTQTAVLSSAQQKWASGFTGVPLTKASPAAAPAPTPAASALDEKVRAMDASWTAALAGGDWKTAATVVNGYSADALQTHLKPLSADQRGKLHQGALDANLGEGSAIAQATKDAAAKPAAGEGAGKAIDIPVGLGAVSFSFDSPKLEAKVTYALLTARAKFSVSYEVEEGEKHDAEMKLKNLQPEIEVSIKQALSKQATLTGSTAFSEKEGSIGASLDIAGSGPLKQSFGFTIASADAEKHEVRFAQLSCTTSAKLIERAIQVKDLKIKFSGSVSVTTSAGPDLAAIAEYALRKFGITIVQDAAAGVAAGGTGTAGAVAVAAAPVAGILGGIAGGVALAAGICAMIGKLEDFATDCRNVCQEGEKELWEYATAYGSTMRGKPGKNQHGNDDAESALKDIMAKTPGMTHDQAVEAAKSSRQNYEELAFRRLLPVIRKQVEDKYYEKEGRIGWFFSQDTLFQVMNVLIPADGHY